MQTRAFALKDGFEQKYRAQGPNNLSLFKAQIVLDSQELAKDLQKNFPKATQNQIEELKRKVGEY
jgi:hypothetical protein